MRSLLVEEQIIWSGSTDGTVRCWDLGQLLMPRTKQVQGFANMRAVEDYITSGILERDPSETDESAMVY